MRRHTSVAFFLASGVLLAQQAPPVSTPPIFRSQTELVLLSFHVTQGKHDVTDLTPADVLLLEDGKPRDFSIFDSPAAKIRMPLDLVLLFDTNPAIPYFWIRTPFIRLSGTGTKRCRAPPWKTTPQTFGSLCTMPRARTFIGWCEPRPMRRNFSMRSVRC